MGSTRLYSQRLSAPANSPCESQATQSTQTAPPARWLEVPQGLHAPKTPQLPEPPAPGAANAPQASHVSHLTHASHLPQTRDEKQRY